MTAPPLPLTLVLVALTLVAGIWDARWRRIPNWLTVPALAAAFVLQPMLLGTAGLKEAALGLGLSLLIHLPLFALRLTGGGDLKLMAAAGALTGPSLFLLIFLASALLGGMWAVAMIVFTGRVRRTLSNLVLLLRELIALKPPHRGHPELDATDPSAATLPRGLVVLSATVVVLAGVYWSH